MQQLSNVLETTLISSDDGKKTFEIKRTLSNQKGKAIIIELYPTISNDRIDTLDLSTLHLLNHLKELGIGCIRILNLYSTVQGSKPSVSVLHDDIENLAYITDVLEESDIKDYQIIIAWGSSLSNHADTVFVKLQILKALVEKKLSKNVTQLYTEALDTNTSIGCHPLYMGLHFGKDIWSTIPYPIETEINNLSLIINPLPKQEVKKAKTGGKKKNVLQNQKQI